MIPAPSLGNVFAHRDRYPDALCCVLFAPLFSPVAKEGLIGRLGYLNSRSGDHINFYCAGYGGYWSRDDFPDMEPIGEVRYEDSTVIPWSFSQKAYAKFVDELEHASTWKYAGETELIVLNANATFEDCLILDIEKMIKDSAIDRSSELLESLMRYARSDAGRASAYKFSDSKIPGLFGNAVVEVLSEGPMALGKTCKAGRHFAVRSIAK